jgi:hypothetical protein
LSSINRCTAGACARCAHRREAHCLSRSICRVVTRGHGQVERHIDAYAHLVGGGIEIPRATNQINQRSFYFADPDGTALEIYYVAARAGAVPVDRADQDAVLTVSSPGDALPDWLLGDRPAAPRLEHSPRA